MRFHRGSRRVNLHDDASENLLRVNSVEFFLEAIDAIEARQGGNSSVFRAVDSDGDDPYVVKFCRFPTNSTNQNHRKRVLRFEREIRALRRALNSPQAPCVIPIVADGTLKLRAEYGGPAFLRYYVMERADSDLARYLAKNELSVPQKLMLCDELLKILRGLHDLGIYHRDIKPENILMRDGVPVFGDLGLIDYRQDDQNIDDFSEKIGPMGYLSPEATNKGFGIRTKGSFAFDCAIDDKSDIFQLGQVFWLVIQDEVPAGHLDAEDLRFGAEVGLLERLIRPMLQYGKQRRSSLVEVEAAIQPVLKEMAIV